MRSTALRLRQALAGLCLSALLLALPLAGSAVAKDRDDIRPVNPAVAGVSPRYYYVYPSHRWGWGVGPAFWNPYWRPYAGYYPGYYYEETTGKVKIQDHQKMDQVFVNGSYAGTAHDMKNMYLNPGQYRVEVRRNGQEIVNRPVYVVVGKTVKIDVDRAA